MTTQSYQRNLLAGLCRMGVVAVILGWGAGLGTVPAFAQGPVTLADVLRAHRAGAVAPLSVEMTGTSTRTGITGPFKITATREEEALIEYGEQRQVVTPKKNFSDDGKKITPSPTPSGFRQLDVTGLFLIAQLNQRGARVDLPQPAILKGERVYRLHVNNDRSQMHYNRFRVSDELDVYVSETGLLAGMTRTFYMGDPIRYSLGYTFSDYRESQEIPGVLLPYRIEVYLKGRLIETLQVARYQFDVPTPSDLFLPRRTP